MATVRNRNGILHIQWYEPFEKKLSSKSTGLVYTESNYKKATKYAKQLQESIDREYQKQRAIGIKRVTIKEAFAHFKRNNQDKHPKTIADYDRFYNKFIETFDEGLACSTINKLNVEDWLLKIKRLKLAQNTIHGYGKQLNHFLNFIFEYNYTTPFKINREVKTKPMVKEKIVFSDVALDKIVKGLGVKNTNFVTTIMLLLYTGLRSSDVLSIEVENIDLKNRILKYYSPKRKKFREIAFHTKLVPILESRIAEVVSGKLLFYKSVENLGKAITRYLDDLELYSIDHTARTFRKTFISLCRSRYSMDASVVRELVGHEHSNTTDKYYNQISIERMKAELEKFEIPEIKDDRNPSKALSSSLIFLAS
jgi:integrase